MATAQVLQRHIDPLTQPGVTPLRPIVNILGAPKNNFPFAPEDVRSVETFPLHRLLEGNFAYLGYTILSAIQSANPILLQIMPPVRASAQTFQYGSYMVPMECAAKTSPQAPPNYVEVQKTTRTATLDFYNLGATTTVQELRTSTGQFIFRGKLITVAIAFIQTAEQLIVQTLLDTPSLYAERIVKSGQHPFDLARAGRATNLYFDIMRRRNNGFNELASLVKQEFSAQSIVPTHVLMTEGMRALMMADPQKTEYYRYGPGAARNQELLADAVGEVAAGLRLVVLRSYSYVKYDLHLHPLERTTVFGQHFRIDHFHTQCDLRKYCDKYTSINVFDMDSNTLSVIDSGEALENDGRFDPTDGRLHGYHYHLRQNLSHEIERTKVPVGNQRYDMFLYTQTAADGSPTVNVAEVWGHMEPWALKDDTVERIAKTFRYAVERNALSEADVQAISAGLLDIQELYDLEIDDAQLASLQADGRVGRWGVRFPAGPADVTNFRPAGYGSVAGYMTIGETRGRPEFAFLDQGLVARAFAFGNAASKLHNYVMNVYDESHIALNPAFAPSAFVTQQGQSGTPTTAAARRRASFLNFFQNIVDTPKATVFVTNGSADTVAGSTTIAEVSSLSPYAFLNDLNTRFPPRVAAVLADAEAISTFETQFANSAFGEEFKNYLNRQQTSTRRRRTTRLSADVDDDDNDAADTDAPLFQQYVTRVLLSEQFDFSAEQQLALLNNTVALVLSNDAPTEINDNLLRAYADPGDTELLRRLGAESGVDGAAPTAFVLSLDALQRAPSGVADGDSPAILVSSPASSGSAVPLRNIDSVQAQLADGSGENDNLFRTTLFSGACSFRVPPKAGVRGLPQPSVHAPSERRPVGSRLGNNAGAQAAWARDAFTDVIGQEVQINENISRRFQHFGRTTNWLERVAAQLFLLAPIQKQVLLSFKKEDIALPVAWLIEQFNRRYRSASMIFLRQPSDEPVGNLQVMDPDTHVGRNAVRKDLMFHTSMYMGVTVTNPQNWYVAHDVATVGYLGGENTVPFDQDEFNVAQLNTLGVKGPSLLYFMVPAGSLIGSDIYKTPVEHDIRGYVDAVHYAGSSAANDSQFQNVAFYPSALYYTSKLNLHQIRTPTSEDWFRFQRPSNTYNTVTRQGYQLVIDPHTNNHDFVIRAQDEFGDSVYPGARDLRESALPRVYKDVDYCTKVLAI